MAGGRVDEVGTIGKSGARDGTQKMHGKEFSGGEDGTGNHGTADA